MTNEEVARHWEENAETWTKLTRAGYDRYRDAQNTPAFLAMLPRIAGMFGLDIGCGEGANTRKVAGLGARVIGVDIAPTFIRHAQEEEARQPQGIEYRIGDAMALDFPDGTFDFATAFMSLMDVPHPGRAVREAARVLRPGGFLQFSILHPCFVPPHRKILREPGQPAHAIQVAGYFDQTPGRIDTWLFSTVPPGEREKYRPFQIPRFHHTLSGWVALIRAAGLTIEAFGEPRATVEEVAAEPILDDTRVAPFVLHIRGSKPV